MAFSYYRSLTIDHTKCGSSDSSNFPVLVSITDATLKSVGNGGHVQSSSGYDIRPYSDSGLSTALTFELERYTASTGEVVMWVKISTVSHTSDTVFYLAYGDTSLTTDGSSTSTWSNSFLMVCHLKDGTTLSVADSTAANTTNTNHGATAASGQIDGGGGFASASSQYIATDNGQTINPTAITISAWVKGTTFPSDYNSIVNGSSGADRWGPYVKSNGKLYMLVHATANVTYDGTGSHTLSTGTWYYITETYDSSAGLIGYVNAASDGTGAANGNVSVSSATSSIGRQDATNSRFWNGSIDEVRVASVARSSDWITTEYNNQNSPGSFITIGNETVAKVEAFTAALSFIGSLLKQDNKSIASSLSFIGSAFRTQLYLMTAALSFIGNQTKSILHNRISSLSFIGDLPKLTFKLLTNSFLSFFADLNLPHTFSQTFTSILSFTGNLKKFTRRALTGVISFIGFFPRNKALLSSLSFAGKITKRTNKLFTARLRWIVHFFEQQLFGWLQSFFVMVFNKDEQYVGTQSSWTKKPGTIITSQQTIDSAATVIDLGVLGPSGPIHMLFIKNLSTNQIITVDSVNTFTSFPQVIGPQIGVYLSPANGTPLYGKTNTGSADIQIIVSS